MLIRLLLCTLLCQVTGFCPAQPIIPRFETIGVNEGLSQSSVYTIYQDKTGFMWFGTADGLNRYDGRQVKVYKLQNPELTIESNYIRGQLHEDDSGRIWFANEAGIHYYDPVSDRLITAKHFQKKEYQGSVFEALHLKNGHLWLMNTGYGIFRYTISNAQWQRFIHPVFSDGRSHYPFSATADKDGYIWFTFFVNEGIYRFNTQSLSFDHFFKKKDCMNVFPGKGKAYWVSSHGAVEQYDSAAGVFRPVHFLSPGATGFKVNKVLEDRFNRLWAASVGDGLAYYDTRTQQSFFFRHDNAKLKSIPIDLITTCYIDRNDNLWIGTDGGGVSRLDLKPPRFNLFPLNDGDYPHLKDYFTKCFYEDEKGRIWFGTHNNGFSIYEPHSGKVQTVDAVNGQPLKAVATILKDRDGQMWIGHGGGTSLFDERNKKFTNIELAPAVNMFHWANYVYDLKQLQNGDFLSATLWGLVHIRKKNDKYVGRTYYHVFDLGSQSTSVCQTATGDVWTASSTSGLLHVQVTDTLKLLEKFFEGVNIRSVHADEGHPNVLWLCSTKGLIRFDVNTKSHYVYTEKDGLVNSYVYGVLEDSLKNLWISTNGGLSYFNRNKNRFENYRYTDGLQSNEFNTGAFYKGPSGTFYFGGIKGFNWFRNIQRNVEQYAYQPSAAITNILVSDRSIREEHNFLRKKTIELSYNENNLSFQFAALEFTRPEANQIQYKLEGWDPEWFTTSGETVRYPNLSPGTYTFKIKAASAEGIWSKEQSVTIIIHAPFWKEAWFIVLLGIATLTAAILLTKNIAQQKLKKQLRELEKQRAIEAERNRISKDMHDEIGSGLTHIALMSELIQTQKKAEEELRKDVSTISSSARRLVQSMSEIVWAMNPQHDTLENLLAYLREQTTAYFEPFLHISYQIEFPDDVPPARLRNEQRRNLFLVIKEALNNALKHAGAGQIFLKMKFVNDGICFTVCDNGKGFDRRKTKLASNGLKNMEKRMVDIGGSFGLQTGEEGTTVMVHLPIEDRVRKGRTTFFTSVKKR